MISIDLRGHLAVVTGGAGQIGRAICATLAKAGCNVAVHYFHGEQRARELANRLKTEYGVSSAAFQADVSKLESVSAMQEQLVCSLGTPDILVNSAVVQYEWKPLLEQDTADYISQFESCVLHNVNMAKAFLPAMQRKGWGRIIGVNSECAMQCFAGQSAYAAGKRGMDGILRTLAKEAGPYGVTVNEVAPGQTYSDRCRESGRRSSDAYLAQVPLRKQNTDWDVANAVLFLASDLASSVTGAFLPVCGGNIMPGI